MSASSQPVVATFPTSLQSGNASDCNLHREAYYSLVYILDVTYESQRLCYRANRKKVSHPTRLEVKKKELKRVGEDGRKAALS